MPRAPCPDARQRLMRHIYNVAQRLTRLPVTGFHALALADNYLAATPVQPKSSSLRLYACTFVWLSNKFHEEDTIRVAAFVDFAPGYAVLEERLVVLEARVLRRLQWRLNVLDAYSAIEVLAENRPVSRDAVQAASRLVLARYTDRHEVHLDTRAAAVLSFNTAVEEV